MYVEPFRMQYKKVSNIENHGGSQQVWLEYVEGYPTSVCWRIEVGGEQDVGRG